MPIENKIAMVIKNDLQDWQKLNVAAFLASSVAIKFLETHGQSLITASGSAYLPFIKHPILIFKADTAEAIMRAFKRAKERELHVGIYTEPLFATKNETENLFEISMHTDDEQKLVSIIVYGDGKKISKALDGLKFHA